MPQDLSAVAWPVQTARLTIRPATPADVDATWAFRRLPESVEWVTHDVQTRDDYAAMFLEPDRMATTLVMERDGEVVGDLMIRVEDAWAQAEVRDRAVGTQAELGWVLDPRHGGQGLATEAVAELIRICFEELGLRRVTALCFADNEPSWRLMERLGMRREMHNVAESLHRTRGWLDGFGYALLAEEWRAARET